MMDAMPPTRILILTPWVPFPATGACQQDRFNGVQQLKKAGYEVRMLAKIHPFQDRAAVEKAFVNIGIPLALTPHVRRPWGSLLKNFPHMLLEPGLLDGAALEYADPSFLATVRKEVESFRPDVLWMEYSMLWPALRALKSFGIPTILKSSLNEPRNCIDEHGGSLLSRIKALPKYAGERIVAQESDVILAITPDEEEWYRSLGARETGVMPLRGLAKCLEPRTHLPKETLDVVFLSSNYNMGHNRDAFLVLVNQIVPRVRSAMPGKIRFHLTGSKFPDRFRPLLGDDLTYEGFLPDLGAFLRTMDVALCPWISGQGMQQKVFEPLCRSLPLLTTKTAGYPFVPGEDVLLCATPEEYVRGLERLLDHRERQRLADNALRKATELFSEEALIERARETVERALAVHRSKNEIPHA